jgi:hypothetical protein
MLTLGMIAAVVYLFVSTRQNRRIALSKGIDGGDLTYFSVFLWLYLLPSLVLMLFGSDFNTLSILFLTVFYVPGILQSRKLAGKLSRGSDAERRAGREYGKAMWLGFTGVGLILLIELSDFARLFLNPR